MIPPVSIRSTKPPEALWLKPNDDSSSLNLCLMRLYPPARRIHDHIVTPTT
jgi:hypothetical protein